MWAGSEARVFPSRLWWLHVCKAKETSCGISLVMETVIRCPLWLIRVRVRVELGVGSGSLCNISCWLSSQNIHVFCFHVNFKHESTKTGIFSCKFKHENKNFHVNFPFNTS